MNTCSFEESGGVVRVPRLQPGQGLKIFLTEEARLNYENEKALKQWRPEGWKTVSPGLRMWNSKPLNSHHAAFEAGADAMLESLKKHGKYSDGDNCPMCGGKLMATESGKYAHCRFHGAITYPIPKGTHVFIPDEAG